MSSPTPDEGKLPQEILDAMEVREPYPPERPDPDSPPPIFTPLVDRALRAPDSPHPFAPWEDEREMQSSFRRPEGTIRTISGLYVDPMNVRPADVNARDISHALSMQCRYNGHVSRFLSVAEHCLNVSYHLERTTGDPRLALAGLLHDAAECWLGDLVRPIKYRPEIQDVWVVAEAEADDAVCVAFGLEEDDTCPLHHELVKEADRDILPWEMAMIRDGATSPSHPIEVTRGHYWARLSDLCAEADVLPLKTVWGE